MFCVSPKIDCPHTKEIDLEKALSFLKTQERVLGKCTKCEHDVENWLCMKCFSYHCGRYVHGHAALHFQESAHQIAFSLVDASFWCYECDSYITSRVFAPFLQGFNVIQGREKEVMEYIKECGTSAVDIISAAVVAEEKKTEKEQNEPIMKPITIEDIQNTKCTKTIFYFRKSRPPYSILKYLEKPSLLIEWLKIENESNEQLEKFIDSFVENSNLSKVYVEALAIPTSLQKISEKVVCLFGSIQQLRCSVCPKLFQSDAFLEDLMKAKNPTCECGGTLVPNISCDHSEALIQMQKDSKNCDMIVFFGNSDFHFAKLFCKLVPNNCEKAEFK